MGTFEGRSSSLAVFDQTMATVAERLNAKDEVVILNFDTEYILMLAQRVRVHQLKCPWYDNMFCVLPPLHLHMHISNILSMDPQFFFFFGMFLREVEGTQKNKKTTQMVDLFGQIKDVVIVAREESPGRALERWAQAPGPARGRLVDAQQQRSRLGAFSGSRLPLHPPPYSASMPISVGLSVASAKYVAE